MKKEKYHFLIIKEKYLFLFKSNYQITKNKIQILYFPLPCVFVSQKKKNPKQKTNPSPTFPPFVYIY